MKNISNHSGNTNGFMMPMIIIMFGVCITILLAIMQYVVTVSSFSNDIIYRQVALTAAKSALDYGKEQFDTNPSFDTIVDASKDDKNSNSIADTVEEKEMFTNGKYKVTYQLSVIENSTSADGRSKRAQGIGRVYLPANSTSPAFTRMINGEILRSQIVAKDPSDFSPLAWYDASCNSGTTLTTADSTSSDCANNTVLSTGTKAIAVNPSSLREERASDGVHCGGSPDTGDGNLGMNHNGECGPDIQQRVGLNFSIPAGKKLKGKTVVNSFIQFESAEQDAGLSTKIIRGIKVADKVDFTSGGVDQVVGPFTTATVTWHSGNWVAVNQSGVSQRTVDISSIIQEIIDQPDWVDGNNIAFSITHSEGPKPRRAKLSPITLNISFTDTVAANNNDSVDMWLDRSGNGFHLSAQSSTARPIRSVVSQYPYTSAPNGKPMVRFGLNGSNVPYALMSAEVPDTTLRKSNTYTALAVVSIRNGTDKTNGLGSVMGFHGSGTGNVPLSPLWRHPVNTFHSTDEANGINENFICQARYTTERLCMDGGPLGGTGSSWYIFASRESLIERDSLMRRSGTHQPYGTSTFQNAITVNAPYNIVIGGHPQMMTPNTEVDISEMILYDRALSCPQVEAVEKYLAQKWGYEDLQLEDYMRYKSSGCPENNIPAY